jgi:Ni/Fe-hydrogenase subunit HybB-like protein
VANKPKGKPEDLGPDAVLLQPIIATRSSFYILTLVFLGFTSLAFFTWLYQLRWGLGTTGLNTPMYWGIYITNFVFFIGISHAGTLISAILRITHAEWRRSITRAAEVITVIVLFFGVGSIIVDLGRPDRLLNVLLYPNFRSPLLWDVCSVSVYLAASSIYLYLPLIPDIAILRDFGGKYTWLYRTLALGWTGSERQHRLLDKAIAVMAVLVIPIAVSVHTVVSWVFGMTVQPMWHSTIFGPYFVVGAIFSGIASLIIAMALIRRIYSLQEYFKDIHFSHLGTLLVVFSLLWFYFTFAENLICPSFLDHGGQLLCDSGSPAGSPPNSHRAKHRHRLLLRADWHVSGAVHDCGAHSSASAGTLRHSFLHAQLGRGRHDLGFRGNFHFPLHAFHQVLPHRLDLGGAGGSPSRSERSQGACAGLHTPPDRRGFGNIAVVTVQDTDR